MLNRIKRLIESIEALKIGLGWWLVCFASVIAVRNFLEGALESPKTVGCEADPYMAIAIFFGHFSLLYVSQFLLVAVILALAAGERIERVSKTVVAFWFIWFPPLFDFIWSSGRGYELVYAHTLENIWAFFVHCADPRPDMGVAAPPGIRVEFVIASLLVFIYILAKTRSIIRPLIGTLLFYGSLIFYVFGFPALVAYAWHAIFPNLPTAEAGTPVFDQLYYTQNLLPTCAHAISLLYLVVTIVGLLAWYFLYDRQKCLALLRNIRLTRCVHFCGLVVLGIWLATQTQSGAFGHPLDYLAGASLCLAIFFAFQAMVVANDIIDLQADRISNPNRPLAAGAVPPDEYRAAGWIYFLLSLGLAFNVSITAMFIILFFDALYLLYSAPPLRLKRFFPLNMLVIGVNSLVAVWLGYSILGGTKTLDRLPSEFTMLVPLVFFLGANIITIKDAEADRADRVWTLPTLLGERWGRRVIGLMALASFLLVPWMLGLDSLWPWAGLFGILAALIVLWPKWREWLFFLNYFIYAIIAILLYSTR
ncbi:MAG: UbiA family prenyltransferase [Candidatus Brocadiia bacterium]